MSAAQQRAERIRTTAELVGGIVADVAVVVAEHAEEIAEWSLSRRRMRRRGGSPGADVTLRSVKATDSLKSQ